ncbi:MAG: hydroxymethylbilane synthase [Alphaproteobacteria bacterium]|nr:hydroxymethylbilane synthase [Alphaproteobacteria bacterium]
MALYQARLVRDRLQAAHAELAAEDAVELVVIRTTGDRVQDRVLAEIGGKGLFTKEIQEALADRRIDLAVHSLKDVETWLPQGLGLVCVLPRDDPRDAFLSRKAACFTALPQGSVVGTSSLRRAAQLLRRRSDLRIVPIRGNAETRIAKLAAGEVEATLLALCGLQRIGRVDAAAEILPPGIMLPAVGQGALAIECRLADDRVREWLRPLHDVRSAACVGAERAMLAALDGSCRTPIAGLAELDRDVLTIEGLLLEPDGRFEIRGKMSGPLGDAAALGSALGAELRVRAGSRFGFG